MGHSYHTTEQPKSGRISHGPSDTPVFSVIVGGGGKAFAVYPIADERAFRQANDLQVQGRVHAVGEADYSPGAHASLWLEAEVDRIATRIIAGRQRELEEQVGRPARHLASDAKPAKAAKPSVARSESDQLHADPAASLAIDEVRQRFIVTSDETPSEETAVAEPERASGRRSTKRNVTK